ncbi:rod shape-determining protein MreD [Pelotomaculum terephthalicicum JT]|uniref:rod shape-determining protein MreD n=1 Tax=Pelotomaculum terephthalicicum TaxID=206393 RepID=UPI0009CF20E6|nr:rod shape-determining protein MreD [Pelotomaculum terephthalicicum]MCG9966996.1 rod shape-determining protein MreD [Pelotomaculum terephthalicicum JT]OPY62631.1 MAG: rod shape-determining protein MreD [Pelotomaculum sp. PtaU1.Bin065]
MPFPALLLLVGVVLIFQTTIMDYLTVFGVKPDLVMLFVVFNGFLLSPREGAFLGFAGGIIEDLFAGSYIGINALAKMAAGYLAGVCGERLYKENSLVAAGVTFFATTAGLLVNYLLLLYLNIYMPFFYTMLRVVLPTALYTAMLVPFLYKRVLRLIVVKNKDL